MGAARVLHKGIVVLGASSAEPGSRCPARELADAQENTGKSRGLLGSCRFAAEPWQDLEAWLELEQSTQGVVGESDTHWATAGLELGQPPGFGQGWKRSPSTGAALEPIHP